MEVAEVPGVLSKQPDEQAVAGACISRLYRSLRGAKLRANVSRPEASSAVVRRMSCQVRAMWGDGGRCLAWFGFAS